MASRFAQSFESELMGSVAANVRQTAEALQVGKPAAGAVQIADVQRAFAIKFGFDLADVKISAVDVDLVFQFPDGSKLVLPGLALSLLSADPPQIAFNEAHVEPAALFTQLGDIRLADHVLSASLTSGEHEKANDAQGASEPTRMQVQLPQTGGVGTASAEAPPNPTIPTPSRPVVADIPALASQKIPSAAPGVQPSTSENGIGTGQFVAEQKAAISATLFGVTDTPPISAEGDAWVISNGFATKPANTDSSLGAQSRATTIVGSDRADIIQAADYTRVGVGQSMRRVELSGIPIEAEGQIAQTIRVSLPTGFRIVGMEMSNGYYEFETNGQNKIAFDLVYELPGEGAAVGAAGYFGGIKWINVDLMIKGENGLVAYKGAQAFVIAPRTDNGPLEVPIPGGKAAVLWSNPPDVHVDAASGDDTIMASASADFIDGGSGLDIVSYAKSNQGVVASLATGGSAGYAAGDRYVAVEGLQGSALADRLTGDAQDNVLIGAAGADTLDGGDGRDIADYATSKGAISVKLTRAVQVGGDANGDALISIEDICGSAFSDDLTGDNAANRLFGNAGTDTLIGNEGDDTLDGGAGNDTADYGELGPTDSVRINLAGEYASQANIVRNGITETDTLISIENVRGGAGADQLTGDNGSNLFMGRAGNDTLDGRGGYDTLDGGDGIDTATYAWLASSQALRIDIGNDGIGRADVVDTSGSITKTDLLIAIENIIGGTGDDTIGGNNLDNALSGGAGNDSLSGRGGHDTLDGGLGVDTMEGGEGDDVYYVDDAADRVNELAGGGTDTVFTTVDYTLQDNSEIEILQAINATRGFTLTGNALSNRLVGTSYADTLDGGLGADTLEGGLGDDIYYVDDGGDAISEAANAGTDTAIVKANYNAAAYTLAANVDILDASALTIGKTLNGNALGNRITGGSAGDTINAGAGQDIIDGGLGADWMAGGSGDDLYYVDDAGDGIWELAGEGQDTVLASTNYTLTSGSEVEVLQGVSAAQGLTLTGNELANTIIGTAFDDRLVGGGGDDSLDGGVGKDTLDGGVGVDTMDGGDGDDVYYVDETGDLVRERINAGLDRVILQASFGSASYTLSYFLEILDGSLLTTDKELNGNELDNTIIGGAGKDRLNGGVGRDSLQGGAGDDTLDGGVGADTMEGGLGDDVYYVDDTNDVVNEFANAGTDRIILQASYSGASYTLATHAEILDASVFATGKTLNGNDFGVSIIGGSGDDTIYGGAGNDTLEGGAGHDQLFGGAGLDLLRGGAGNDILDGGAGADTMLGGLGNDLYYVDNSNDVVTEAVGEGQDTVFTKASYTLQSGSEVETLQSWNATQGLILTGNGFVNTIIGSNFDDTLDGGGGADSVSGGLGNDVYKGRASNDTFDGGSGNDTADFSTLPKGVSVSLRARNASLSINSQTAQAAILTNVSSGANGSNFTLTDTATNTSHLTRIYFWRPTTAMTISFWVARVSGDRNLLITVSANYTLSAWYECIVNLWNGTTSNPSNSTTSFYFTLAQSINGVDGWLVTMTVPGSGSGEGQIVLSMLAGLAIVPSAYVGNGDSLAFSNFSIHSITSTPASIASQTVLNNVETLIGTEANDYLTANSANRLEGRGGNDVLNGGAGVNTLAGGTGNDTYYVDGDDVIAENLNEGTDAIVLLNGFSAGATYTIAANVDNLNASMLSTGITIIGNSLNNYIGGGLGNDTIYGGAGNDTIDGSLGNDLLYGDAGNDSLYGGTGDDTLDGGTGADFMSGGLGNDTYIVDDPSDWPQEAASQGTDTVLLATTFPGSAYTLLAWLEILDASALTTGITLTGNSSDNTIIGGSGNDVFNSGGGNDFITGGFGNDTYRGGTGNDRFDGGSGSDTADFSSLTQTVNIRLAAQTLSVAARAVPNGATFVPRATSNSQGLDFTLTETVSTSNVAHTVDFGTFTLGGPITISFWVARDVGSRNLFISYDTGQAGALRYSEAIFNLSNGTVSYLQTAPSTTMVAATMNGKSGWNITFTVSGSASNYFGAITFALYSTSRFYIGDGTSALTVEDLKVTATSPTTSTQYTLTSVENVIGGSADDTLTGDARNNILRGNGGNDTLDGDVGSDTVDYSYLTAPLTLALSGQGAQQTVTAVAGTDVDVIRNIENVIGGSGNDTITGNELDNLIRGGAGSDRLNGGAGNDTIDYSYLTTNLTLALAAPGVQQTVTAVAGTDVDVIQNFENIIGGSGNDTLTGNAVDNIISGGLGNDSLDGGAGNDTLDYSYARGNLSITLAADTSTWQTIVAGTGDTDVIRNFENVMGGSGNDTITGNAAANVIGGGLGNDILDGGAGLDMVDYSYALESVVIVLAENGVSQTVTIAANDIDTIQNFENVRGGQANDTLIGNSGDNVLDGSVGGDLMIGGAGNDTYIIDSVLDCVVEQTNGGFDTVKLTSSYYGSQFTGTNIEVIDASAVNAPTWLSTNTAASIIGSAFVDNISGSAGDDSIFGGAGADTFNISAGNDTLDGGSASETNLLLAVGIASALNWDATTGAATVTINGITYTQTIRNFINVFATIGADRIIFGNDNNYIRNYGGNDTFDGGGGIDSLHIVTGTGVTVDLSITDADGYSTLTTGIDVLKVKNFEIIYGFFGYNNIRGSSANETLLGNNAIDNLFGGGGNDVLSAGAGNDTLDGGTGADTMAGSADDDTYYVDNVGDIVDETSTGSSGVDLVIASVNYTLTTGVENLQAASGSSGLTLTGNSLSNSVTGWDGNDTLSGGGSGVDTLFGGLGDDTLILDFTQLTNGSRSDGGNGADTFQFANSATSTSTAVTLAQLNMLLDNTETINFTTTNNKITLSGANGAIDLSAGSADRTALAGIGGGAAVTIRYNIASGTNDTDTMPGVTGAAASDTTGTAGTAGYTQNFYADAAKTQLLLQLIAA